MKLITEHVAHGLQCVTEENTTGTESLYIKGIFMQSELQNRNGRIYPRSVMEKAVLKYNTEQVSRGRAVGELNHPPGPTINLDKVSHLITELTWEGNNVMGKAKILDTPMGMIARGLLSGGVQLGVSSRGMGSISTREGKNYVGNDFQLATIDIVADPSAHEAFVNGIMEGADWLYDTASGNWIKQEMIESVVKKAKSGSFNEAQAIREFKNILLK